MPGREHFTAEYIAQIIELRDGCMYWRPRGITSFDRRYAGKPVSLRESEGYLYVRIQRRHVRAHRLVWTLSYGHWPSAALDHINGCRTDNRIENLRQCDARINGRNKGRQRNNSSGCAGVVCLRSGRWRAQIIIDGEYRHLGCFASFEEAAEARLLAQNEHGFSVRHGTDPGVPGPNKKAAAKLAITEHLQRPSWCTTHSQLTFSTRLLSGGERVLNR